jgi:thiosulfate/3-mercaptopyruvate sulfurtransferase
MVSTFPAKNALISTILACILSIVSSAPVHAADGFNLPKPQAMLIDGNELHDSLLAPRLQVLDTRPEQDYVKSHIPGAVWVDVRRWQKLGASEGGFHNAQAWGKEVGRLGIRNDSRVVVYGAAAPDTCRIWWTLKYLGLDKVRILDGGWQLWIAENHPREDLAPAVHAAPFTPRFQPDRLEEHDSLKRSLKSGKVTVVDARSAGEFTGTEARGGRGGHIPGAKHLEWKELIDKEGRFKPPDQLRMLFQAHGIQPDDIAVPC